MDAGGGLAPRRGLAEGSQKPRSSGRIARATVAFCRPVSGSCPAFPCPCGAIPVRDRPGKQTNRDDIRHVVCESNDFTPKVTRAVRVQTVNGDPAALAAGQRLRAACDLIEAEAREGRHEGALGIGELREHSLCENTRARHVVFIVDAARSAQDVGDADALALAREFVTPTRAAHAVEDAFVHQSLRHRLEMPRRKAMARRELACGDGTFAPVERNVYDSSNRKQALAGKE